jgi:hypothetical protein
VDTEPGQAAEYVLHILVLGAFDIGVLYSQDEYTSMMLRVEIVEKSGPGPPMWRFPVGLGANLDLTIIVSSR